MTISYLNCAYRMLPQATAKTGIIFVFSTLFTFIWTANGRHPLPSEIVLVQFVLPISQKYGYLSQFIIKLQLITAQNRIHGWIALTFPNIFHYWTFRKCKHRPKETFFYHCEFKTRQVANVDGCWDKKGNEYHYLVARVVLHWLRITR